MNLREVMGAVGAAGAAGESGLGDEALARSRARLEAALTAPSPAPAGRPRGARMRPATPRRRLSAGLAAVAAVVMIVATAAIVATLFPRPSTTVATSPTAPAPVPPLPDEYLCGDTPIPIAALEARQAPDTLDEDALAALAVPEAAQLMNDPDDWIVVSRTPDEVMLLTDVMHAQWMLVEFAPIPTHEILTVFRSDGAWHYGRWEPCTLAQEHDGLAVAGVGLDPEHPPTPESTRLHLLVMERACNSGQDARGRIELISLEETADAVSLSIGIRPRGGAADCQGNPPTPFTVELSGPLGDRVLRDARYVVPQDLR